MPGTWEQSGERLSRHKATSPSSCAVLMASILPRPGPLFSLPSHQCPELTCPTLTAPAWQNPRLAGISIKVSQSRHFRAMQQGQYHGPHLHSDNTSISWFSSYPCRFFQVSPGACATRASVLHQGYHRWLCSAPPSGSYWHGLQCGQSTLGGPRPPRATINSALGWLVQSPVTLHTFPGHSRSSELLTVAYNFQILTSSPDLPVLRLFPLQAIVHGPQSKAPLGRGCSPPSPAHRHPVYLLSPSLPYFPNFLPGLSLLNEALACESHSQELHPGNLTYKTSYLSISTQDPTGKFKFNKPQTQVTLPPPGMVSPLIIQSGCPSQTPPSSLPLQSPSPLRRKPGQHPIHPPPSNP